MINGLFILKFSGNHIKYNQHINCHVIKSNTVICFHIEFSNEIREGPGMKQSKLKYHFHNPNPPDKSAEYILKILIIANAVKAENALKSAQEKFKSADNC